MLAYFKEKSITVKSPTLCSIFFIQKTTLNMKKNINLNKITLINVNILFACLLKS